MSQILAKSRLEKNAVLCFTAGKTYGNNNTNDVLEKNLQSILTRIA